MVRLNGYGSKNKCFQRAPQLLRLLRPLAEIIPTIQDDLTSPKKSSFKSWHDLRDTSVWHQRSITVQTIFLLTEVASQMHQPKTNMDLHTANLYNILNSSGETRDGSATHSEIV